MKLTSITLHLRNYAIKLILKFDVMAACHLVDAGYPGNRLASFLGMDSSTLSRARDVTGVPVVGSKKFRVHLMMILITNINIPPPRRRSLQHDRDLSYQMGMWGVLQLHQTVMQSGRHQNLQLYHYWVYGGLSPCHYLLHQCIHRIQTQNPVTVSAYYHATHLMFIHYYSPRSRGIQSAGGRRVPLQK